MKLGITVLASVIFILVTQLTFSQGVGVNQTSPVSMLDVNGGVTIGATYSGTDAAPANGMIVEGNVGIGTNSPRATWNFDVNGRAVMGNQNGTFSWLEPSAGVLIFNTYDESDYFVPDGLDVETQLIPNGGTGQVSRGINNRLILDGTSGSFTGTLMGLNSYVGNTAATSGSVDAIRAEVYNNDAVTMSEVSGIYSYVYNNGGGTISTARSIRTQVAGSAGGTITNAYGIYMSANSGGTITNNYGLYIENQSAGATNYAIYSAGGQSYHAGNFGIGTSSPQGPLEVRATASSQAIYISTTGSSDAKIIFQDGTTDEWDILRSESDNTFRISESGAGARFTVEPGGNIGIGTTNPADLLHLQSSTDADLVLQQFGIADVPSFITKRARGTSAAPAKMEDEDFVFHITGLAYDGDEYHIAAGIRGKMDGTTGDNDVPSKIEFYTTSDGSTSNNTVMTLAENGHVGIGTTEPASTLHVLTAGTAGTPAINSITSAAFQRSGVAGANNAISIISGNTANSYLYFGDTDSESAGQITYDHSANDLYFQVNSAGTAELRIADGGNVGINSDSPSSRLEVVTNSSDNQDVAYFNGGGDAAGEDVLVAKGRHSTAFAGDVIRAEANRVSSSAYNLIATVGDADGTPFYPFTVRGDGNVGIGTTSPGTALDVDGDMAVRISTLALADAANHNIAIGSSSFVHLTGGGASATITGIAGGVNGKMVILYNATGSTILIKDSNAFSTAANRIVCAGGTDKTISVTGTATLIYNSTSSRWVVVSVQ